MERAFLDLKRGIFGSFDQTKNMDEAPQFLDHSKDFPWDIGSVLRTGELRCGVVDHIESDIKSTPSRLTFSFPHEKQQKTVT